MAGAYTDIIDTIMPDSAPAGATVDIEVHIRNTHTYGIHINATGRVGNEEGLQFGTASQPVDAGSEGVFHDSFTMPSQTVTLTIWSWYWSADQEWVQDDIATATIVMSGVPSVTGQITDKWVNKGADVRLSFPAAVDPDGQTFEIAVKWKNTSTSSYDARIEIVVHDPTGAVVKDIESPYYGMSPGATRENAWNIVAVNRAGDWNTTIRLVTSGGLELNKFEGVCLIAAGASRAAIITSKSLFVDTGLFAGYETPIPAQEVPTGSAVRLYIAVENTSSVTYELGFRYTITDPAGAPHTEDVAWKNLNPGGTHTFAQPTVGGWTVALSGTFNVLIEIIDREGIVYAEYDGELFSTVGIVGGEPQFINDVQLLFSDVSGTLTPPTTGITVNQRFQIMAKGLNPGPGSSQMALKWVVLKPDMSTVNGIDYESFWTNQGNSQGFIVPDLGSITVDQEGQWSMVLELLRGEDEVLIDTWEGNIFTAGPAPPGGGGIFDTIGGIFDIIPLMVMMMMMSMMMNMMSDPRGLRTAVVEKATPFVQIFTTPTKTGKVLKGIEGVGGLFKQAPKE